MTFFPVSFKNALCRCTGNPGAVAVVFCALLVVCAAVPQAANARVVRVATHADVVPLYMPDGRSGLEYDILHEALALEGLELYMEVLPVGRLVPALVEGRVDAITPYSDGEVAVGYLSDSHLSLHTVAVSHADYQYTITTVGDLTAHAVTGFAGASRLLGSDFAAMAAANSRYTEQGDQRAQVCSFFARRDRVIVLEQTVFAYYAQTGCNPDREAYTVHPVFVPDVVGVVFADHCLRDRFNAGLEKLRRSGRYAAIMRHYLGTAP